MNDTKSAVISILVEECGCDPELKDSILLSWPFPGDHGGEYRFCGDLGWGGKLYWTRGPAWRRTDAFRVSVACYQEDVTPERREMIQRANARLLAIQDA